MNPTTLTKFTKFLPEFQKNSVLRKLLHDTGRAISLVTDPKSTAKPTYSKLKFTPRTPHAHRTDIPPPPPPRYHHHQGA